MESHSFQLDITTPSQKILSAEADSVTLPGVEGEMQVLPGHASLLSAIDYGVVSYEKNGKTHKIVVHRGFATVGPDKVVVLADRGESADEIDLERAKKAAEMAQSKLDEIRTQEADSDDSTIKFYEAKLFRAVTRIKSKS